MIARHKAFVHAHNAELDSSNPRPIHVIIAEVMRAEKSRSNAAPLSTVVARPVDTSGPSMQAGFAALAQSIKARDAVKPTVEVTQPKPAKAARANDWRCVMSEAAGKPFYFNPVTGIGQFDRPVMDSASQESASTSTSSSVASSSEPAITTETEPTSNLVEAAQVSRDSGKC